MNASDAFQLFRPEPKASRRQFLRHFFTGAATSTVLGASWTRPLLATCLPKNADSGVISLRPGDYPTLAAANGSVRLALNPFTLNGPNGPFYPILVNRGFGSQFYALETRCTHRACVVDPFSAGPGACVCRCHGSRYGLDGARLSGPAPADLKRYDAVLSGPGQLCIHLPDARLNYRVQAAPMSGASAGLFRLTWPSTPALTYEVRRRNRLAAAGEPVAFSLSPDGPSMMELTATGPAITVFVDPPGEHAFYSVAVRLTEG